VIQRVGEVAYELELSKGSMIHNMFHVSCLKKALGQHVTSSTELPPLDEEGKLVFVPEDVFEVGGRRLRNRVIREIFQQRMPHGKMTISCSILTCKFEDKQTREGWTVMSLSK